jgi:glycosyltransferase involved in cell wall biosynthesis
MSKKAAIIYWGSRGGGPRQLLNLIRSTGENNKNIFFYVSSNNELLNELKTNSGAQLVINQIPTLKIRLIIDLRFRNRLISNVLRDLKNKGITKVYFLLPHPWDVTLAKRINRTGGIEIWRGIHDVRRHPGDFWPNGFTIRKLIKYSNTLVCYSAHIENRLSKYGKSLIKSHLFEVKREAKLIGNGCSVLFVGRIKKYKGLDLLAKAWPLVANSKKSLTVAGDGKVPKELQKVGAMFIHKWLSNSEIEKLVRGSNLIVLPYIEASQSGVIAIAHSLSTPVVVTPVGGLVDQVIEGKNGLIAAEVTPKALAMAIDAALTRNWALEVEENPLPNFLAKLQMD